MTAWEACRAPYARIGDDWAHGDPDGNDPTLGQSWEGRIRFDAVLASLAKYGFRVERRGSWARVDGETLTGHQARGLLRWSWARKHCKFPLA